MAIINGTDSDNNSVGGTGELLGTAEADIINGLAGFDEIHGKAGNDTLNGGADHDIIFAGEGDDLLDGGTGDDVMIGGVGNDVYIVDHVKDEVSEDAILDLDRGIDTVKSSISFTLPPKIIDPVQNLQQLVENLTLTGNANINGTGNALNNKMIGNAGNNVLNAEAGNDDLIGGAGNDTLNGGDGIDQLFESGNSNFTLTNSLLTGNGTDQISSIEVAILSGGNSGNTLNTADYSGFVVLNGGAGNDILKAGSGNDILDGGSGSDQMAGGNGRDFYAVDNVNDKVVEASANSKNDIVESSVSFTLGDNLEDLALSGTNAINGTGNSLNNVMTGNAGKNKLNSNGGNDTLNGSSGDDTLSGGLGTDTLHGDDNNDQLLGEDGSDQLFGDSGNDTLKGDLGNDELAGGVGDDQLRGGEGSDILRGEDGLDNENLTGNDKLFGEGGVDFLKGEAGNDQLFGGLGEDALVGGSGDDILVGVDATLANLGKGEIDTLIGNLGGDVYVLGLAGKVFYNDGLNNTQGINDYGNIAGFDTSTDQIQLSGNKSQYTLGSLPVGIIDSGASFPDLGIFLGNSSSGELIGVVRDGFGLNLNLSSGNFKFV